ncbi:MAG: hypothetical protein R6V31_04740, partial [Halohasta sp.]
MDMFKKPFVEKCKVWWWGGYYVPVRNTMNFSIEKKHLTADERRCIRAHLKKRYLMITFLPA